MYSIRRANLKKCLYSYQDYMNTLKNEKSTLSAISAEVNNSSTNNEDAGLSVEKFAVVKKTLNEKRASIDTCNKEAANYVRMVKVQTYYLILSCIKFHFIWCLCQILSPCLFLFYFHVTSLSFFNDILFLCEIFISN